jgi:hypothetical protein
MPKLTITFVLRGWIGGGLILVGALTVVGAIAVLPGILFGTRLTAPEAEQSIRDHLLARVSLCFSEAISSAPDAGRGALGARYFEAVESLEAVKFVSVDVDTVIFSYGRINKSFVVEAVMLGKDQKPETRYFCFMGQYVTGECSKWNWLLAW